MGRAIAHFLALTLLLCTITVHGARFTDTLNMLMRPWGGLVSPGRSGEPGGETECDDLEFRKANLKLIKEMPFVGLLPDLKNQTKFEASGMVNAMGRLWVIFDNLHALGSFDEHFEFKDEHNSLIGSLEADSQFEGLTYKGSTGTFFAMQEAIDDEEHGLVPFTMELQLSRDHGSYKVVRKCPVHYLLTHGNKGFEGVHFHEYEGHQYLLGLCEGNFCMGGDEGKEPGNGRIVVSTYFENGGDCGWNPLKIVTIPSSADFMDYSDMAFRADDRVAITSQENSALWLGTWDWTTLEFVNHDDNVVLHFPRNQHCKVNYCNVEGIQWIDNSRIVVASDKAKKYQPYECTYKDQTLSVFSMPVE